MERSIPGFSCYGKFHTGILIDVFTMNLADHWMDGTDNGHTDGETDFQVELHFGWQTQVSFDLHMDGLVMLMV